MNNAEGIQRYQQTNVTTMPPAKMIVLLYEALARHCTRAVSSYERGDRIAGNQSLTAAQTIISELRSALDHTIGGDVSHNLEMLYDYMFQENLKAIATCDAQPVRNVMTVISPLLAAWTAVSASIAQPSIDGADQPDLSAPRERPGPDPASPSTPLPASLVKAGSNHRSQPPPMHDRPLAAHHRTLSYSA
jgi:flagellar protein FliS